MNFAEQAAIVDCNGQQMIGIVASPESPMEVGVLIIVGGPQYRVGSHRQFVLLARRLASEGVPVMRFDCRGMGDSTGPAGTFESIGPDIAAAIEAFGMACPGVEKLVLLGLCDAASAALSYCHATRDPRVAGLTLLNPWVRSEAGLARTQIKHYYGKRLTEPAFWKKLAHGGVDIAAAAGGVRRSLASVLGHHRRDASTAAAASTAITYQDRMAEGLRGFSGPVLLIISGRDLTAREFEDYARRDRRWTGLLDRPNVARHDIAAADHTFSSTQWREQVASSTIDWLRRMLARAAN